MNERLVLKIKNDLGEEIRKTAKDKVLTVSVTAKRMEGAWKIDLDNGELMNLSREISIIKASLRARLLSFYSVSSSRS